MFGKFFIGGLLRFNSFVWPLSIILFLTFILFATSFALTNPLCCADDASIAVVSKNLASGLGYLQTVNYWGGDFDYHGALFDPGISTGIASVLPVSIAMYVFGALPSIPGLVHLALYTVIVLLTFYKLKCIYGRQIAGGILMVFVFLILSTSPKHFEQWYAQLGEVLAALLLIIGTAVLCLDRPSFKSYSICGLLMGGAFLSKNLAALYVACAAMFVLSQLVIRKGPERALWFRLNLAFFLGCFAPVLIFEFWKMTTLGLDGWLENWHKFQQFVLNNGVQVNGQSSGYQKVVDRLAVLEDRFFVSQSALVLSVAAYLYRYFSLPMRLRMFSLILASGVVIHFLYWIFWSIGWPRYLYIAVVVGSLVLSISFVAGKGLISRLFLGLAIAMVVFSGFQNIVWQLPMSARTTGSFRDAQLVSSYIELKYHDRSVHTQWWAHISALEYLSSMPNRYSIWNEPRNRLATNRLMIIDSRFLVKSDLVLTAYLKDSCIEDVHSGVYTLYICGIDEKVSD